MKQTKIPSSINAFLARRILKPEKGSFSGPIVLISILSLVLGLSVMMISIQVLMGFKKEIREKLSGFSGHIHIIKYNSNPSLELPPVYLDSLNMDDLKKIEGVKSVQKYISKAAIIRTDEDMKGMMVKGVGADYDSSFFSQNLLKGRMPRLYGDEKTEEVLISNKVARLLNVDIGERLRVYFVDNQTEQLRGRRLEIVGIYQTSVEEFDEQFMLADIRVLQRLNRWDENMVSGVELMVTDFDKLEAIEEAVYEQIPYDLTTENIKESYPQIFDWLKLQDINVIVILILIVLVASVSMVSTLLVLILERTQMIGILKALGARNMLIRKLFLTQAAYIIIIGLFFGNILGIGLGLLQKHFGLIKLDADTYYMSVVPIHFDIWSILLLNIGTLILVLIIMIFPSMVTSRIQPAKSIRFD